MDKFLIAFSALCFLALVSGSEVSIHDYDIQIHPIHGHHGHDALDFATSIRYDKRYHLKAPAAPEYQQDVVYQYVADEHEGEEDHGYGY